MTSCWKGLQEGAARQGSLLDYVFFAYRAACEREGTIGSLLEGLSEAERAQIYLIMFIAHADPIVHPIYGLV